MPTLTQTLLATLTLSTLSTAQQTQSCSKGVHIIVTTGIGSTSNPDSYGLLGPLKNSILDKIPNSSSYSVPYPKQDAMPYHEAVAKAESGLMKALEGYVNSCPYGRVVLLGYSAGAVTTMNAVCGASSKGWPESEAMSGSYEKNIIATIVYGDETYTPGQSYNHGTCTSLSAPDPRTKPSCGVYHDIINAYCDTGDDRCCPPDNGSDAHHTYAAKHDAQALQFVVKRHDATKKHPRWRKHHGGKHY